MPITAKTPSKQGSNENAVKALQRLADKWPSPIVARAELYNFSGGLIAPGTAANNDSIGTGIPGAFRVSRKIAYPVDSVIEWLVARLEVV